jgi:hypothetical protein
MRQRLRLTLDENRVYKQAFENLRRDLATVKTRRNPGT